ncbi:MAG: GNAT family N-acetyltransferase [Pseudomonadota bacterium]
MAVAVYESFSSIPDTVAERCSVMAAARFQLSLPWFRNLYDNVYALDASLRVYAVNDEGGHFLAALFCIVPNGRRQLRSLTNFYSLEYGLSGLEKDAPVDDIVSELAKCFRTEGWAQIDFRLLFEGDRVQQALNLSLKECGFAPEWFFQFENWYRNAKASETFDDYYAARPSRMKNTIKRKGNKLHREHTVRIEIIEESGPALNKAVDDYVTIYNRSWKEPEPYVDFMPAMIRLAAREGILMLGVLYVDDAPAAAQLWLCEPDGRSVIYKLAYDEAFKSQSVGSVLSKTLFEKAFVDGRAVEIDYGVGSEGYKKEWLEQQRNMVGVQAINTRSANGVMRLAIRNAKTLIKRLLRK